MNCPFCSKNISTTARFCPFCGQKVDVTFDEIKRSLSNQEETEKRQGKIKESRRIMSIGFFILFVSLIVFAATPSPRMPQAVPVYRVNVPEVKQVNIEKLQPVEFEIPGQSE